jgi:hypothetical protein
LIPIVSSLRAQLAAGVCFIAVGVAITSLPFLWAVRLAILLAFIYSALHLVKRYVFLKDARSITEVTYDKDAGWSLTRKDASTLGVRLLPTSTASAQWMFLAFRHLDSRRVEHAVLASDSVRAKDWSLLHLLVNYARPV